MASEIGLIRRTFGKGKDSKGRGLERDRIGKRATHDEDRDKR